MAEAQAPATAASPESTLPAIRSVDDMYHVPRDGQKYELIEGALVVSPAGMQHEEVGAELLFLIRSFLAKERLGKVFGSSVGYQLAERVLLSPDVSFVRTERLPRGSSPEGFGRFAPDLAVEIISPGDSMTTIEDKVELYLKHGTQLVWVINPKLRRATIYRADGSVSVIRGDGVLSGEAVLPGFTCALAEILPG
ncbi:MAG: Uma2 family endonuclease [Thermoflexales bacterium]|nr:Uma2 family endonuclease [Thermoflexales bacterium]MDW8352459.1 Uma2 family endonuclease [Anaerolineae bacterium]